MDFERLERNICDNIIEAQLKLGYEKLPLSLNYTLSSLGNLLGRKMDAADMQYVLFQFALYVQPALGQLTFRPIKDGFCITVPEEGTAFVHENCGGDGFMKDFIDIVRGHCSSVEQVLDVFRKYSGNVSAEEVNNGEFDYLVRFSDGIPDEYLYCLSVEEEIDGSVHVTYHRFIKEDYEELGF